jgi:hypothetical protein
MASGGGGGIGGGGGGGGGVNGPSACLQRLHFDTPDSILPQNGTFGPTVGAPKNYPGAQRNSLNFDTVKWASPGMVNLGVNPRRITITQDGIYMINATVEFSAVSTENVIGIMENGYDTVGSHSGGQAATDGLEPNAGRFVGIFGFTTSPVSALLQLTTKVRALKGYFYFLEHQCDVPYLLNGFGDPRYALGIPQFSVSKIADIP